MSTKIPVFDSAVFCGTLCSRFNAIAATTRGGTMKRVTAILGVAALAFASSLAMAQTKLKFAHVYETSEPYHTAALWAAQEIQKRTNNRYQVEVFPASTLGKETDINQGLTLGTVDIIYTS